MNEDRLAEFAVELAARVRQQDPDEVAEWLLANTSERERWQLLFVQAAAGPASPGQFRRAKAWAARLEDGRPEIVDEIAIERACRGESVPLSRRELLEAVKVLTNRGYSSKQIAERLGTYQRKVTLLRSEARAA